MSSNHLILCCPLLLPFLPLPLNKGKSFLPLSTVHEGLDFKITIIRNRFKLRKQLCPRLPKKGYCWHTQPFFLPSKRGADFFLFLFFFSSKDGKQPYFRRPRTGAVRPSRQAWAGKLLSRVFFQNRFLGLKAREFLFLCFPPSPGLRGDQRVGTSHSATRAGSSNSFCAVTW